MHISSNSILRCIDDGAEIGEKGFSLKSLFPLPNIMRFVGVNLHGDACRWGHQLGTSIASIGE